MLPIVPLLLGMGFYGLTAHLPRPATALRLVEGNIGACAFAGDAAGEVRLVEARREPTTLCVRPGRIVALEATLADDLAVAYVPTKGPGVVEAWKVADREATLVGYLGDFPRDERPIIVKTAGEGYAVARPSKRLVRLFPMEGRPRGVVFPQSLVGLTVAWREDGKAVLVAALADGAMEARDVAGTLLWRTKVAPVGGLTGLAYEARGAGSTAAWTSNEGGGRIGLFDVRTGAAVGAPLDAPGATRGYALGWDTLLVATGNQMWGPRRVANWTAPSPIVATDAAGRTEAAALADGTVTIRVPLWHWMRTGDEHPVPSKPPR